MKSLLLTVAMLVASLFVVTDSQARGPFLFPNVAAVRFNSQARALNAQANRNFAVANLQASRGFRNNFVFVPRRQAVFFGSPSYYAPPVQFAAPAYGYQQALPPCQSYLPPVQAFPSHSYFESQRFYGGY